MSACNYNCSELEDHELVLCGAYPKGGIDVVGYLECDHEITDFSDETSISNAIADGKLKLIKGVKATYNPAEPIQGEGALGCGPEQQLDGFNHTLTIKDFNVKAENDTFYQSLNKRTSFVLWRECQNGKIRVVQKKVYWTAIPANSPESNKEKQMYTITAAWSSGVDEFPVLYDDPGNLT